jgi:DNA-binding transcriptional regulator YiaG
MTRPTSGPTLPHRGRTSVHELRAAGMPSAGAEYVAELALQEAVGNEILRLRTAANLTQTALAARAGVPVATVRRYEHGSAAAPVYLLPLLAIANALQTTVAALIDPRAPNSISPTERSAYVLTPTSPWTPSPPRPRPGGCPSTCPSNSVTGPSPATGPSRGGPFLPWS